MIAGKSMVVYHINKTTIKSMPSFKNSEGGKET
jgi:hypothetical protein